MIRLFRFSSGRLAFKLAAAGLSLLLVFMRPSDCPAADEDAGPQTFERTADETLTVVRMNHGDVLRFQLRDGEERTFVLEETSARIVERSRGGIVYSFECRLTADGQPLTLKRYVCSQETFYEPWVVNGVRLWLSSSAAIFKLVPIRYPDQHDKLDEVDAILALQDATLPICPQPMRPWFPIERRFIDVGQCYNGDDPWLGPYLGQACHVGLDINMPTGTPLYAPIDFDDQWIFSADHRWRGVRRWPNGDIWGLQSHHVDRLLVEEHTPLEQGTHYGEAAGKGIGSHPHSHFEFRVGSAVLNRGRLGGMEIDPWILFWQIFETDKHSQGEIRAEIEPLSPTVTGRPVPFSAAKSRPGREAGPLRFFWTFGDGGWSNEASPQHTFVRPGIYPVTLVVDDGRQRATRTQHITVNGEPLSSPALALHAPEEVPFQKRPLAAADVYGWPVKGIPHTLQFAALPQGPAPAPREVQLKNIGAGRLSAAKPPQVSYWGDQRNWLQVTLEGDADENNQRLSLTAVPRSLSAGRYEAVVAVNCPGAVNGRQAFRVELHVRPSPTEEEFVIDDRDDGFDATAYFWVGHQFLRTPQRGHRKRYLTNGGVNDAEAFARFTPDLAAGGYEVLFHPQTPFTESSFPVRIRHATGEKTVRFHLQQFPDRSLGVFEFAEGTNGFVEILAKDSEGLVIVDAVVFRRVE
jgi:PKD repeat protein